MDGKFIIHTVSMFVKYIFLIFYFLIIILKILVESILKDKVNHIVFCFTACPMPLRVRNNNYMSNIWYLSKCGTSMLVLEVYHKKLHSLLCCFLFLIHYTLFFTILEISYKDKNNSPQD